MKPLRTVLALICALGLSACAVGPDYQEPGFSIADKWFSRDADSPVSADAPVDTTWWTVFDDPLLTTYIEQAAAYNNDVESALARVTAARAARRVQSGAFFPQVDASASAVRSGSSDASSGFNSGEIRNSFDAGFDASWELDIFGQTRRSVEAADARVGSAVADYHAVMLSTLSEVARTYYEARGQQKRIIITENNATLLKETFDLAQARFEAGEASAFDTSRAQAEYEQILSRLPNLQAELQASLYSLGVLTGQMPEALLDEMATVQPLPAPPDLVPVGLRSELLRRRPDIERAERTLAAEVADIGVATAELFPKFFLTGAAGTDSRLFGDLFRAAAGAWSLGALVEMPIFRAGALRAQIDIEDAEAQAAFVDYEQTVLEAIADAETALIRYGKELETQKRLENVVTSRRRSISLADELFNAGEEDYLAVLDAERELIAAEDALVISETQTLTNLIALYTALGGGWEFIP